MATCLVFLVSQVAGSRISERNPVRKGTLTDPIASVAVISA